MLELNLILVLVLKPLVIILDVTLLVFLKKIKKRPEMNILFWSTFIFLVGELACALDVYIMHQMTFINEGIHDVAMLVAFSGYLYGIYRFIIHKIKCFKLECPQYISCDLDSEICDKGQQCGIYPVWLLLISIVLAIFPMFSTPIIHHDQLQAGFQATVIGTYLYNRTDQLFVLQQIIFPSFSIITFIAGIIIILATKRMTPLVWKLLSFGSGALGFVYFRVVLINLYHPNIIFTAVGEEILELLFMILILLWIYPLKKRYYAV